MRSDRSCEPENNTQSGRQQVNAYFMHSNVLCKSRKPHAC